MSIFLKNNFNQSIEVQYDEDSKKFFCILYNEYHKVRYPLFKRIKVAYNIIKGDYIVNSKFVIERDNAKKLADFISLKHMVPTSESPKLKIKLELYVEPGGDFISYCGYKTDDNWTPLKTPNGFFQKENLIKITKDDHIIVLKGKDQGIFWEGRPQYNNKLMQVDDPYPWCQLEQPIWHEMFRSNMVAYLIKDYYKQI